MKNLNHSKRISIVERAVVAAVFSTCAFGASAQEGAAGAALEEIVVTAQKREQTTMDIPMTVNALTGAKLERFNVVDFRDLDDVVAGITINVYGPGESYSAFSSRGIKATNNYYELYWNNVRVPQLMLQEGGLYDMERVEVLKGPQGSLQGRAAPGGAIMQISRRPDVSEAGIHGTVRGQAMDDGSYVADAAATIPLVADKLAIRVAGLYNNDEKYDGISLVTGTGDSYRARSGRLSLAWEPLESLRALFIAQSVDSREILVAPFKGNGLRGPIDPFKRSVLYNEFDDLGDTSIDLYMLETQWDLPGHQLTLVTGYASSDVYRIIDTDRLDFIPGRPSVSETTNTRRDFSQEVRLASHDGGRWEYMFGVYYGTTDRHTDAESAIAKTATSPSSLSDQDIDEKELSAFTYHTLRVTDRLSASLGLRHQQVDVRTLAHRYAGDNNAQPRGTLLATTVDQDDSYDYATGSLQLSYDLTDSLMTYASYQRSFRPGGSNVASPDVDASLFTFNDEKGDYIELGVKGQFFDRRLRAMLSVFQHEFDGFITSVRALADIDSDGRLDDIGGATVIAFPGNGDAEVRGWEAEWDALLTDNWSFGGNVGYSKAEFVGGSVLPCTIANATTVAPGTQVNFCDYKGQPLSVGVPEWTGNLNTEFRLPQLFAGLDWYARGSYSYTGRKKYSGGVPDSGGYGVYNAATGLRSGQQGWDVSVWARNLTNKKALTENLGASGLTPGYSPVLVLKERQLGVTASYNF